MLHLTPEDPEPLRHQVVRQLRDRIVRGELGAGDHLPAHRQLARQHRVAPSTIGAAYQALEDEGLVVVEAGVVRVALLSADRRRELTERLQFEELVAKELGQRELEMARDVQRRLLPPPEVGGPGWEVAARCVPARIVAGDFYEVLRHFEGAVDVVVADVAGKGFAASLIMASVKAMLPFVVTDRPVAESLSELNRRLVPELGRGEFVALAIARYRPAAGRVEVANGGLPDPYLLHPERPPIPLSVPGPRLPLGVRDEVRYASRVVDMGAATRLVMLTDGLPEARDIGGEPLGYDALETLLTTGGEAPAAWLAGLFDRVQRRTERAPEDDWTAVLLVPHDNPESPCS